eukprot:1393094-Amorphochlora_amoeboformis.AAC.1
MSDGEMLRVDVDDGMGCGGDAVSFQPDGNQVSLENSSVCKHQPYRHLDISDNIYPMPPYL